MKFALVFVAITAAGGCMFPEEDPEDNVDVSPPDVCGDGVRTGTEVCDDGNRIDGDGCSSSCGRIASFQIHWRTASLAGDLRTCPVGFDLAEIHFQSDGPEVLRVVDCADGIAELAVTPRPYLASVRFVNEASGEIYGETLPEPATSGQTVTMYPDAGYARLTWDLRNETAQARTCQATLVDDILATFTPVGGGAPITTWLDCSTTTAVTAPLPAGSYDLVLSARNHASAISRITIAPRSAVTDPGPIVITIPSGT
jgi:cysteine-rich repeat protein